MHTSGSVCTEVPHPLHLVYIQIGMFFLDIRRRERKLVARGTLAMIVPMLLSAVSIATLVTIMICSVSGYHVTAITVRNSLIITEDKIPIEDKRPIEDIQWYYYCVKWFIYFLTMNCIYLVLCILYSLYSLECYLNI